MANWDTLETKDLISALFMLKTPREMKHFLRDLLTEQEILEFGKRWKAARMLHEKIPYSSIEKETGLSSTTVARISKWLREGMGGISDGAEEDEQKVSIPRFTARTSSYRRQLYENKALFLNKVLHFRISALKV